MFIGVSLEKLQLAGARKLEKMQWVEKRGHRCHSDEMSWIKSETIQNIRIPHLFSELRTSAESIILKLETNTYRD